jgi:hypothetical protein
VITSARQQPTIVHEGPWPRGFLPAPLPSLPSVIPLHDARSHRLGPARQRDSASVAAGDRA